MSDAVCIDYIVYFVVENLKKQIVSKMRMYRRDLQLDSKLIKS